MYEECSNWKNRTCNCMGWTYLVFLLQSEDCETRIIEIGDGGLNMKAADKIEKKRKKEQYVVEQMIHLYCQRHHHSDKKEMCPECQALSDYAKYRSEKCPFMEKKTFCANCKVHCYKPEMREKIRKVMRYSGPRMILYHPILAVWHLVCSIREKRK